MKSWLKQEFLDRDSIFYDSLAFQPTDEGVPQGGPISPTIMNMTLNGIEKAINLNRVKKLTLKKRSKKKHISKLDPKYYLLIRFADDCILLMNSKKYIQKAIKQLNSFLKPRGLKLNAEKTIEVETLKSPFSFVGYQFKILKKNGKFKIYSLFFLYQKKTASRIFDFLNG